MRYDLAEHVSRRGRVKLSNLILENGWSVQRLAEEIGVSRQAIYLWLDPEETHPKNSHLEEILRLAIKIDKEVASEILRKEVNQFKLAVEKRIRNFSKKGR